MKKIFFLALLVFLITTINVPAQTHDVSGSSAVDFGTSLTVGVTASSGLSNRLALGCSTVHDGETVTAMTYNSIALNLVDSTTTGVSIVSTTSIHQDIAPTGDGSSHNF